MVRRCIYPSFHFFVSRSRSVADCAHIQAFTFLLTKTLSRSRSVARRVRVQAFATKTLKIKIGGPPCTYPSIRNKNLQTYWTPWSTQETRGLWARPPVLTPVPAPAQAIHSRACLNLHDCDIQSTEQKSPCVNTFLRPYARRPSIVDTSKNKSAYSGNRDD